MERMNAAQRIAKLYYSLRIEPYRKENHLILARRWWRNFNEAELAEDLLSEIGLVIYDGEQPVAMSWIFLSNSPLAQIGWTVTNPECGPKTRMSAVALLIDELTGVAKREGYKGVMTFSNSSGLTRIFQSSNYVKLNPHDFLIREIESDS